MNPHPGSRAELKKQAWSSSLFLRLSSCIIQAELVIYISHPMDAPTQRSFQDIRLRMHYLGMYFNIGIGRILEAPVWRSTLSRTPLLTLRTFPRGSFRCSFAPSGASILELLSYSLLTHHDINSYAIYLNVLQHLFDCCYHYNKLFVFCQCSDDNNLVLQGWRVVNFVGVGVTKWVQDMKSPRQCRGCLSI